MIELNSLVRLQVLYCESRCRYCGKRVKTVEVPYCGKECYGSYVSYKLKGESND